MVFIAAATFAVGCTIGFRYRVKVLLAAMAVCLIVSVIVAITTSSSFGHAALIIFLAQALLQCGYFLGAILRLITGSGWRQPIL